MNHDRVIDILDVATIAFHFGCVQGNTCYNPLYDFDGDGRIGIADISCAGYLFGQRVFGDQYYGYYCNSLGNPDFKSYSSTGLPNSPWSWKNWNVYLSGSGTQYPIKKPGLTSYMFPGGGTAPYSVYPGPTLTYGNPAIPVGYIGTQCNPCTYSSDNLQSRFPSNPDCSNGVCTCSTIGVAQNLTVSNSAARGDIVMMLMNAPIVDPWAYAQICYAIYGGDKNYALLHIDFTHAGSYAIFETMENGIHERIVSLDQFLVTPGTPLLLTISADYFSSNSKGTVYKITGPGGSGLSYKSSLHPQIGDIQAHAYTLTGASLAGIGLLDKAPPNVTTPALGVMWGNAVCGTKQDTY